MKATRQDLDIDYASDLHLIKTMSEDDSFWERTFDAKLQFLNFGVDPRASDCVRPEVAWSWIISRNKGLEPDQQTLGEYVSEEYVVEAKRRNAHLIEATKERLQSIASLNMENDYIFELMDIEGLSLIQIGDLRLHQFVGPRYLVSEKNAGTNAHSLSMRHKRPFALIGPEHYCFALQSLIACAAPILDQYDNSVGALLLTQPIPDSFTTADRKLLIHAMSLVASIANSISAQLRADGIESEYDHANMEAQLYESISRNLINSIQEGILVVGNDTVVQHASPEAAHILGTPPEDIEGSPLCALVDFGSADEARAFFESGKSRTIVVNGYEYRASSRVIAPETKDSPSPGYIITLNKTARPTVGVRRKGAGDVATTTFEGILGKSPQIAKARDLARKFAHTGENILITGESGTGKELFAQAIHNEARPGGPFMSINCASIPPRLIESELFGYEPGTFTGADKTGRAGKIELADGGTLFLDEIGDMPFDLQSTLLRVLENKRVMRLGGKSYKQVDFRLVSATNKNLAELSATGRFREDLLYRLSVLSINLPPLRERADDTLFFVRYFLNECQLKTDIGKAELSDEARAFVTSYTWPGNVRQLKHAVYSAYYTCEGGVITVDDFPAYIVQGANMGKEAEGLSQNESSSSFKVQPRIDANGLEIPSSATPTHSLPTLRLTELEQLAIEEAMRLSKGNAMKAVELLGISKATLYRKLREAKRS